MMTIKTGAIILIAVVAATVVFGQAQDNVSAALSFAFRHGKAGRLAEFFPEQGRVRLAIASVNIASGDYSSTQAVALLQQAFDNFETISLALNGGRDALKIEWKTKNRNTGEQKSIVLYIAIQTHQNTSVITSIRGS